MLASVQLPVVFTACVNSYHRGRRQRHLVRERKETTYLLTRQQPAFYQPVQKGRMSHTHYLHLLDQYQSRIQHLHLVGHADGDTLRVEAEQEEMEMTPTALGQLIDLLPNLTCVFLSGCATPNLLDLLLRKDVPAILVTQTTKQNREAAAISRTFYRHIGQGSSIKEAFGEVKNAHPGMKEFAVTYDFDHDEMAWFGKEAEQDELAWGLYYLTEHERRLKHKPNPRQLIPYTKYGQRGRKRQWLRYAAVLLVGLSAVGIALSLKNVSSWHVLLAFW